MLIELLQVLLDFSDSKRDRLNCLVVPLFASVRLTVEGEQGSLNLVHLLLSRLGRCNDGADRQAGTVECLVVHFKTIGVIRKIMLPCCELVVDAVQAVADLREELALILLVRALVQVSQMSLECRRRKNPCDFFSGLLNPDIGWLRRAAGGVVDIETALMSRGAGC